MTEESFTEDLKGLKERIPKVRFVGSGFRKVVGAEMAKSVARLMGVSFLLLRKKLANVTPNFERRTPNAHRRKAAHGR